MQPTWGRVPAVAGAVAVALTLVSGSALGQWRSAGQNASNTRWNDFEKAISVSTVGSLHTKWIYTTDGDVSATPTVASDSLYVVDFGGSIHRINRTTGTAVWKNSIASYVPGIPGLPPQKSRTSPAVAGNTVVFGTQIGAWVVAVDSATGGLRWKTQLDADGFALVTQSPVVVGNRVYVGVASQEENFAAFIPNYPCCHSRGSVAALDLNDGHIVWQTKMISDAQHDAGFSGAGVWGSTVAVDTDRNRLYVTTGNNYSASEVSKQCVRDAGEDIDAIRACTPADVHFDSVMALDMATGAIAWTRRFWSYDAWNVACIPGIGVTNPDACPMPTGPDFDFAQGASLFSAKVGGKGKARDLVGAGQKSGFYWALDRDTGDVVWQHEVGPGSSLGGLEWGSAVDGTRVYAALVNLYQIPYTLQPSGVLVFGGGGWAAMDAATGAPVWQIAEPNGGMGLGPVTGANGVIFACSMPLVIQTPPFGLVNPSAPNMFALNAATGAVLWSMSAGASCNNGPSIADGDVYWGTGYGVLGPTLGTSNKKLYAFTVN